MFTPVLVALAVVAMIFTIGMAVFSRLYHETSYENYYKISMLFFMGVIICVVFMIVFGVLNVKFPEGSI